MKTLARARKRWIERARGSRICPIRICRGILREETDGLGRLVVRCPQCERRLAGLCRDCPRPVYGTIGKATRCAPCAARAKREAIRRYENSHREKKLARARKRYRTDAALRAHRAELARAWRAKNPDKVRWYKRREALKQDPKRLAYFDRYNAKREEAKRAHARASYYRRHPNRPQPTCRKCSASIPWAPPGRPPVECNACAPAHVVAKRRTVLPAPRPVVVPPPVGHPCAVRGCPSWLTGAAKKCRACKDAGRVAA